MSTSNKYFQSLIECKNHSVNGDRHITESKTIVAKNSQVSEDVAWACKMTILEALKSKSPKMTKFVTEHMSSDNAYKIVFGDPVSEGSTINRVLTASIVTALAFALYKKVKKNKGEKEANRAAASLSIRLAKKAQEEGIMSAMNRAKQNAKKYMNASK